MFVPLGEFDRAYTQIKQGALGGECSVLILVAPDADALASSSMLTSLLKSDFITYKLLPVASFDDIFSARESLKENPDTIKSVILLNAGATTNVLTTFEADEGDVNEGLNFYIIDSHRPVNLANVYNDDRVFVFDDGETKNQVPALEEVFGSSDSEEESDDDGPRQNSKRRRTDRAQLSPRSRRLRREIRSDRQREYYSSTYYGLPASTVMWELLSMLNKGNNHSLWLAIIGLTDQFLHDRIDNEKFLERTEAMKNDVLRTNAGDDEEGVDASGRMQIKFEAEYRFMLLRHWSLYDAMFYSRYVAARLGLWRQKGRRRLENLLAKMGLPLTECKQKYINMDPTFRVQLTDKFEHFAAEFDLENCVFGSFVSICGYREIFTATDVVYSISALLEDATTNEKGQMTSPQEWRAKFYVALDALNPSKRSLLKEGMEKSKIQHQAVLRQVQSIVEGRNGIRKSKSFRYVIIKDDPDQRYFLHPVTLTKLGLFLMDTYRFSKDSRKKTLPLVLAALNVHTDTYVVVGIWAEPKKKEGVVFRNEFGQHFQAAGIKIDARIRMTGFESSVMEIKSDDMLRFIGSLQNRLQGNIL